LTALFSRGTLRLFALSQRRIGHRQEVLLRALGTVALASWDQGASDVASTSRSSSRLLTLLLNADPVVQAVMIVLLLFSAGAWAVIVYKRRQFAAARIQTRGFLEIFRRSSRFAEVQGACSTYAASPLVGLFQAGHAELNVQLRGAGDGSPGGSAPRQTLKSLDAVDRALIRASTVEVAKLEHRVPFLATTASITPYIGLFGTVWGILMAFQGIAEAGGTSLEVVAPPIAEALIATAMGLFAAIPAVYFYNDLTSQVKTAVNEMEDFSLEFLTIAERNFT
jgi:biopolymer transport protein TolQ